MLRPGWVVAVLVFHGSALVGCGSPSVPTPRSCSGDEGCDSTSRCVDRACVENALPTAEFSVAGDLVASAEITLDASPSSDPDRGDTLSSYQWSVSSADAACEAPVIASTARTVQVRFGCGGHWDVQLIVFDGKQAESAPTVHTLAVAERTGPALVTAGPDQTMGHACAGQPVTCTTAAEVQLSATLDSQAALTVRWTVQPPAGRELGASRRVRFEPSATALTPKVVIETDGTAISGDWVFRVEALNGADVLAADVTRVSVTNRAPAITGAQPAPFPHGYVASSQFFVVNGAVPVQVTDPDGDPVARTVSVHHAGDGDSAFTGTDNGASIGISIMVPAAHPEWLIAPSGLSRSVTLNAVDVNGAAATPASYAVSVSNRRPTTARLIGGTAPHTFDPVARTYVSTPALVQWTDPDGDPLIDHQVTLTGASAADCPTSTLLPDGTLQLDCARIWTSGSDLTSFTVPRTATVEVSDPWTPLQGKGGIIDFRIGNRAPVASSSFSTTATAACTVRGGTTFCAGGGSGSPPNADVFAGLSATFALSGLTDPDGDPLQITPDAGAAGARGSSCSGTQACTLGYTVPRTEYCGSIASVPPTTIPFTATDGVSPVNLSLTVTLACR